MMKKEFKNWREFLAEEETAHDKYEANLYLAIEQSKEIDRTEIMDEIRAIHEVTTVYREREISTSAVTFIGEYIIRFILPHRSNAKSHYFDKLKPQLENIDGLSIHQDNGYEKIGEE
jgi:hypothetical protein